MFEEGNFHSCLLNREYFTMNGPATSNMHSLLKEATTVKIFL